MSRILTINYTSNPPVIDSYAGEIGENRAVTLKVFPELEHTGVAMYVMNFAVEGGVLPSRAYDVATELEIDLTTELTQQEILACQLVGLSADGESVITKTPIVKLILGETLTGEVVVDPETGDTIFDEIAELKEIADTLDLSEYAKVEDVYDKDDVDDFLDAKVDTSTYNFEKGLTQSKIDTINTDMGNIRMSISGVAMRVTTLEGSTQAKITESNKLPSSLVDGLSTVATSGNYNDLTNKPTIPSTESLAEKTYVDSELAKKQNTIDSTHKLDYSFLDNVPVEYTICPIDCDRDGNLTYNGTSISASDVVAMSKISTNYLYVRLSTSGTTVSVATLADTGVARVSFKTLNLSPVYTIIIENTGVRLVTNPYIDNIKTVNGNSLIGTGNVTITGDSNIDDVKVNGTSVVTNKIANIDISGKQDTLTSANAGDNITINNGIISATGGGSAVVEMAEYDGQLVKTIDELYEDYESGKMLTYLGRPILSFVIDDSEGYNQYIWSYLNDEVNPADYSINFCQLRYMISETETDSCWEMNATATDLAQEYLSSANTTSEITDSTSTTLLPNVSAVKGYVEAHSSSMPSGTNNGDILVWNGTRWMSRPLWQNRYQPVEYIESTGTQYLELTRNFTWNNTVRMVFDFALTNAPTGGAFLSGLATSSLNAFCGANSSAFRSNFSNQGGTTVTPLDFNRHIWDITNGSQKFDGVVKGEFTTNTSINDWLLIFGGHEGSSYGFLISAKIYSANIYKDNVLVYKLYPCYNRVTNVIGMYDSVSDTFFTNAGSGTFLKGADV